MAPADNKRPLTILHTNDFHNRLTASAACAIEQIFARTQEPKLLIDSGDAGGSTNITFRSAGEPILEEMSRLGYSAMTVGNRDFHVSRHGFRAKLFRAGFPILCANIRPSGTVGDHCSDDSQYPLANSNAADEPPLRSYLLLEVGGWRVLIIGLTVPMVTERMWERKLSAYIFDPPIRTASRLVPRLQDQFAPDLTIALTHIGTRLDRELAEEVPGIDLIVGGHSHEVLPVGETIGQTLLAQAGSHGRYIGAISVEDKPEGGSRPKLTARIESL